MSLLEIVLIVAGISLDIFAALEIEGAMLVKINRKTLFYVTGLVVLMQQIFFFFGYLVSNTIVHTQTWHLKSDRWGAWTAVIIFAFLGLRLLIKAVRRELVHESRREIRVQQYAKIIAVASIYTILAGLACGFLGIHTLTVFVVILISSVLAAVLGIFVGYRFGYEGKTLVYAAGGILLWIAGLEILLRSILHLIHF